MDNPLDSVEQKLADAGAPITTAKKDASGHPHITTETVFIGLVIAAGSFLAFEFVRRKKPSGTLANDTTASVAPDALRQSLDSATQALTQAELNAQSGTMAAGQGQTATQPAPTAATGNAQAPTMQGMVSRPSSCPGGVMPLQYNDGSWYCPVPSQPVIAPTPSADPNFAGFQFQNGAWAIVNSPTPTNHYNPLTTPVPTYNNTGIASSGYSQSNGPMRPIAIASAPVTFPSTMPQIVVHGSTGGRGSSEYHDPLFSYVETVPQELQHH